MGDLVRKQVGGVWHSFCGLIDGETGASISASNPLPVNVMGTVKIATDAPIDVQGKVGISGIDNTVNVNIAASAVPINTSSGVAPQQALTNQSAVGLGAVIDYGVARSNHNLTVTGTGLIVLGAVALMGSNDGVNWVQTSAQITSLLSNGTAAASLANTPFRYVTAKVTTLITGGGNVSAWIASV